MKVGREIQVNRGSQEKPSGPREPGSPRGVCHGWTPGMGATLHGGGGGRSEEMRLVRQVWARLNFLPKSGPPDGDGTMPRGPQMPSGQESLLLQGKK